METVLFLKRKSGNHSDRSYFVFAETPTDYNLDRNLSWTPLKLPPTDEFQNVNTAYSGRHGYGGSRGRPRKTSRSPTETCSIRLLPDVRNPVTITAVRAKFPGTPCAPLRGGVRRPRWRIVSARRRRNYAARL